MKTFTKGVLVGIGVGLLIAPMTGEEMRHLLGERFKEWRNALPEDTNAYMKQVTERVSQTGENLRSYAQQAASKVKDASGALGGLAHQSAQEVKQTGQDLAGTTRPAANSAKVSSSAAGVMPE